VRWESEGTGEYTHRDGRPRRARHRDHPAPQAKARTTCWAWKLKSIIRKYSDHIVQPIVMKGEKWDEEKKEQVATDEDETVNQASALWARRRTRSPTSSTRSSTSTSATTSRTPLTWTHARVEGRQEYTQLLYVPARAPFDMWDRKPVTASSSMCAASSSWTTPSS
jgi:molecular chaperone HtpG